MSAKHTRAQRIGHALVVRKTAHGPAQGAASVNCETPIKSIITEGHYKYSVGAYMRWRKFIGLSLRGPYQISESMEYLREMAEALEQKQLDTCRQALQKVLNQQLPKVVSHRATLLASRAYRLSEVQEIMKLQCDSNALCTALCYLTGLRDHETLTLRRATELDRANHRPWSPDLFKGMDDYETYTVEGKGGLRRFVAVPAALAVMLEERRLPESALVVDRKVNYEVIYPIGGGQAFSQSFSDASKKVLGFSFGSHGLRHSYAQLRIQTLRRLGFEVNAALKIVSEELGHFRISVTWAYLR